jgi:voltage-gated potassium channel
LPASRTTTSNAALPLTADRAEVVARRRVLAQRLRARRELHLFMRRLGLILMALGALLIAGTIGFAAIEGVSLAYGFEWTLDTITTLGSIPDPSDSAGRALKVGLELLGIGTLFYAFATVAEFFVSGQLSGVLEDRRTQKMIDRYSDHYIVCGFGRVGRQVARDLSAAGAPYVVVDDNVENREAATALGLNFVEGPTADDEILRAAGIDRAAGVIACVDSDAENIFIALTARELRSDITIIARASAEDSEKKLLRAGADRVVSPYKTSGSEMARVALHPQVGSAVHLAEYRVEEIEVVPACAGVGKTIQAVRGSSIIVALRRADGSLEPQPAQDVVINAGDKLVALGNEYALERLEALFQPASAAAS